MRKNRFSFWLTGFYCMASYGVQLIEYWVNVELFSC